MDKNSRVTLTKMRDAAKAALANIGQTKEALLIAAFYGVVPKSVYDCPPVRVAKTWKFDLPAYDICMRAGCPLCNDDSHVFYCIPDYANRASIFQAYIRFVAFATALLEQNGGQ